MSSPLLPRDFRLRPSSPTLHCTARAMSNSWRLCWSAPLAGWKVSGSRILSNMSHSLSMITYGPCKIINLFITPDDHVRTLKGIMLLITPMIAYGPCKTIKIFITPMNMTNPKLFLVFLSIFLRWIFVFRFVCSGYKYLVHFFLFNP